MALSLSGCHSGPSIESRYAEARLKLEQGYIPAALESADRELRRAGEVESAWNWRFRLVKAEALIRTGKASDALALLQPVPPSALPADVVARRKTLQGQSLCQINDFADAKERLEEAAYLAGTDHAVLAEVFLVRGKCEQSEGHLDLAQQDFRQAQELAEKINSFVQASAMGNLAVLLMRSDRYDEAIDQFQRVLSLARVMHSPLLEEITLGNLGFCYAQLGDWRRAISFSQQAETMATEIKNLEARERWLIDLGKEHYSLWELTEAESDYLKALPIAEELHDAAGTAVCFNALTRVALRKRDLATAERYRKQGDALQVESERLHFVLDGGEIAAAGQQWSQAEERFRYLSQSTKADPVLRSMAQRELGEVYWKEGKSARADQMFRQSIETAEAELARIMGSEHRMSFLDQERFYDSYVRFLAAQNKSADALGVAERARAQAWGHDSPATRVRAVWMPLSATQALLKRHKQVVLAYWVTDDKSFLWVITPSRVEPFTMPGHLDLQRMIEAYNAEIQDHRGLADSPSAQKLYEVLIRPAESLIPKGSHVIVVPSKVLSWVSFEALVVPGQHPHYWIEDVDVQVAGSLARMSKSSSARRTSLSKGKELLLLGAPVEASADFPALKNAPEEMRRVESHFVADQQTIISGKDATPQAYSAAGPGNYRLIHLDTHGTASDLSPLDSAIILSRGPDDAYKLYAREIKDIPLHADLVTISACYGAGTRWYNVEGVVGLGWAFLRAGARRVIASLWEVDDASSPQLMDDFYGELSQGKSAAEALRDAKLKMLHSSDFHRHPYYWASLQLYTGS